MKNDYDDDLRSFEGVTRPFTLRGVHFEALPTMPAQHLSALADMQTGADSSRAYRTVTEAIRATLVDSYRDRWDELMEQDQKVPIRLQTLLQIADDLVEEATGRPPTPPTPSGSTGENGSTRSTDGSASTVVPGLPSSIPGRG